VYFVGNSVDNWQLRRPLHVHSFPKRRTTASAYDDPRQQRWWDRLKTLAQNEGPELLGTGSAGFKVAGIKLDDLIAGRYPEGDQSWADNLSRTISNWAGEPAAPPAPVTGLEQR
jgi:hypothetical protein